jgi:hypothetical protein
VSEGTDRNTDDLFTVDRRTTLKWLGATILAAHAQLASPATKLAPKASGYGTDPNLVNPSVPWPRTLSRAQLLVVASLCDLLLPDDGRSPSASAVGVHDFVDEWVSAPYPDQQADRTVILRGLEWLTVQTTQRAQVTFDRAPRALQVELFERVFGKRQPAPDFTAADQFMSKLRYLAMGAYYTSEAGIADLNHIGNTPIAGDYPGPTAQARDHLQQALKRLGLSLT